MTCLHCNYEWKPRVKSPVSCPRCKQRLDVARKLVELYGEGGTNEPKP